MFPEHWWGQAATTISTNCETVGDIKRGRGRQRENKRDRERKDKSTYFQSTVREKLQLQLAPTVKYHERYRDREINLLVSEFEWGQVATTIITYCETARERDKSCCFQSNSGNKL